MGGHQRLESGELGTTCPDSFQGRLAKPVRDVPLLAFLGRVGVNPRLTFGNRHAPVLVVVRTLSPRVGFGAAVVVLGLSEDVRLIAQLAEALVDVLRQAAHLGGGSVQGHLELDSAIGITPGLLVLAFCERPLRVVWRVLAGLVLGRDFARGVLRFGLVHAFVQGFHESVRLS